MNKESSEENLVSELQHIYESDQKDRSGKYDDIDVEKLHINDVERLKRAKEIYLDLKNGSITLNGGSLYHLAMIFQHGGNSENYSVALELANMALETGHEKSKWLSAAAEDRHLLSIGEKQKWGTQFKKEGEDWEQSPMQEDSESGITDEMRKSMGVPILEDQMKNFLSKSDI